MSLAFNSIGSPTLAPTTVQAPIPTPNPTPGPTTAKVLTGRCTHSSRYLNLILKEYTDVAKNYFKLLLNVQIKVNHHVFTICL